MLNEQIKSVRDLRRALRRADEALAGHEPAATWEDVAAPLRAWDSGRLGTRGLRIRDTMSCSRIFSAPDPGGWKRFWRVCPWCFL